MPPASLAVPAIPSFLYRTSGRASVAFIASYLSPDGPAAPEQWVADITADLAGQQYCSPGDSRSSLRNLTHPDSRAPAGGLLVGIVHRRPRRDRKSGIPLSPTTAPCENGDGSFPDSSKTATWNVSKAGKRDPALVCSLAAYAFDCRNSPRVMMSPPRHPRTYLGILARPEDDRSTADSRTIPRRTQTASWRLLPFAVAGSPLPFWGSPAHTADPNFSIGIFDPCGVRAAHGASLSVMAVNRPRRPRSNP